MQFACIERCCTRTTEMTMHREPGLQQVSVVHWHVREFPLVKVIIGCCLLGADRPSGHGMVRHGLLVDHNRHLPNNFAHLLPLLPECLLLIFSGITIRAFQSTSIL